MSKVDTNIVCQPCLAKLKTSWVTLIFRSEANKGIKDLDVTITDLTGEPRTDKTDSDGKVTFRNVVKSEIKYEVSTESLLKEVEQYPSAQMVGDFPPHKEMYPNAIHRQVALEDLWSEPPEDEVLVKLHKKQHPANKEVCPERETVFCVKALRCHVPEIQDTDNYNLVSSYNMCLMSMLAYDDFFKGIKGQLNTYNVENVIEHQSLSKIEEQIEAEVVSSVGESSNGTVVDALTSWRTQNVVSCVGGEKINNYPSTSIKGGIPPFLLKEVPYSQHFKGIPLLSVKLNSWGESSEAFILWNDSTIIIAFRGTQESFNDLIKKDLNILHKNISLDGDPSVDVDDTYEVHAGFYFYVNELYLLLRKKITELLKIKKRHIIVCGHSLGGASASLCSLYLDNMEFIKTKGHYLHNEMLSHRTFTYGSPRVFVNSKELTEKVKKLLHFRHVNNQDIIPIIPPEFTGYRHQGQLIQLFTYQDKTRSHRNKQIILIPQVSTLSKEDSLVDLGGDNLLGLGEHFGNQYASNLAYHISDYYEYHYDAKTRKQIIVHDLNEQLSVVKRNPLFKTKWRPDPNAYSHNLPAAREQRVLFKDAEEISNSLKLLDNMSQVNKYIERYMDADTILYGGIKPTLYLTKQLDQWKGVNDD